MMFADSYISQDIGTKLQGKAFRRVHLETENDPEGAGPQRLINA